ncbi:MAG TPA: hypothetical protein VGX24_16220 [Pyrinomonadaceae bacterium]|jgi:hypothetical protein|nr:hypothetical protein [Pyrinomonadaceae bacterium]
MGKEFSGTRRSVLRVRSVLAVVISLHIFNAGFLHGNEKSFASGSNPASNSQRCGDEIFFSFSERTGENIDPADFASIMIVYNDTGRAYKLNIERKGTKEFVQPTLCGHREMKVTITYQNKKMELILKNIPGDQGDIFLQSIPFAEGTYTFDFEHHLDKTCREDVEGRRDQCVVPPKKLKKITPDSREQEVTKKPAE